jgi:flagellar biogenesis protein FliO
MTAFCLRLLFALLAFAPLAAEIEQATPEETHTDHFFTELLNMASTLGLVLLGLLIITWLLKRTVSARVEQLNVTSAIKILERRSLAPKVAVYILEIWGTRLIVGETPAGLVRLGELPAEAGKFAQLLKEQPP